MFMNKPNIDALLGIRFFAIFHIYLYHLWLNHQSSPNSFLPSLASLPEWVKTFLSHGWMSTSLFFVLSGFTLYALYTNAEGTLKVSKRVFWLRRMVRIYPIHIILLCLSVYLNIDWHISQGVAKDTLIYSAFLNATLFHAWVPNWVSFWNWPTWALSTLLFLYLITPYLINILNKISTNKLAFILVLLPLVSLMPTVLLMLWGAYKNQPVGHLIGGLSSLPLMWVPGYFAGMVLSKIVYHQESKKLAWHTIIADKVDLAILAVVVIALIPNINEQWKFILRHGGLMLVFFICIYGLAKNKGYCSKIFKLKIFSFLGEISFSIFIWQGTIITLI